ncbi:MAG: hypothetical protein GEU93_03230 [Propionibacteriales bacterium]|nr:hypothetical protein [Propionibacteriales bacterium]
MGVAAMWLVKVGVLVAVLAGLVACGSPDRAVEGSTATSADEPESPVVTVDGEPLLSCGHGPGFTAAAMTGGVQNLADHNEVTAALEQLVQRAGMDAPTALQDTPLGDAEWYVLGKSDGELTVATGPWDRNGPGPHGQVVTLNQVPGGWDAASWGDCSLAPVLTPGLRCTYASPWATEHSWMAPPGPPLRSLTGDLHEAGDAITQRQMSAYLGAQVPLP